MALGLAVAFLWLLLATSPGRQVVLGWIGDRVERSAGIRIEADDFDLDLSGALRVTGVVLAAGDETPFLLAESVSATWRWKVLKQEKWHLDRVEVVGPQFFPGATLPGDRDPDQPSDRGQPEVPLDIERIEVVDGTLIYQLEPETSWLSAVRLEVQNATGRLISSRLMAQLGDAGLILDRGAVGEVPLALQGRLEGPLNGPFTVEGLVLRGEGLFLEAEGTLGEGSQRALPFRLSAKMEPARLLPDMAAGSGVVEVEGDLELRRFEGGLRVRAQGFPAALVEPWLDRETMHTLGAAGTFLEADGELRVAGPSLEQLSGRFDLLWRRGDQSLASAEVVTLEPEAERVGLRLRVDTSLLPGEAGQRRLTGTLVAESWETLGDATIEQGALRVDLPDVGRGIAAIRKRWPQWIPRDVERWRLPGRLRAEADLQGLLRAPDAEVSARWQPAAGQSIVMRAQGLPLALEGRASFELGSVDLGGWPARVADLPLSGQISGEIELRGSPESPAGATTLELIGVSWQEEGPRFEEVELSTRFEGEHAWLDRFEAVMGESILVAEGELTLERPVDRGGLDFRWTRPVPGLEELVARAELQGGSMVLDATVTEAGSGQLEEADRAGASGRLALWATVPLANLGRVPELRSLLSDLPIRAEGGPLELRWEIDDGSGSWLTKLLPEDAPEIDWRASMSGELALDLARPKESRGVVRVSSLEVEVAGGPDGTMPPFRLAVTGDGSVLELIDGQLSLQASRIETDAGALSLRARGPLAGLGALVDPSDLPPELQDLLTSGQGEPGSLTLSWPDFDTEKLVTWSGNLPANLRMQGDLTVDLAVDPLRLEDAEGELRLEGLAMTTEGQVVEAAGPIRLEISGRNLRLAPGTLRVRRQQLEVSGEAVVAGDWLDAADPLRLADLVFVGVGAFPMAWLNPYLEGGKGYGFAAVDLKATGADLASLTMDLQVLPGDGRLVFTAPYLSEISELNFSVKGSGGSYDFGSGALRLNGGQVDFSGRLDQREGLTLEGLLDAVPYRLDYGLSTVTTGNFGLRWPYEGIPKLSANLLVERGVLRRNVNLDQELLELLFGSPVESWSEDDGTEIELDVSIATVDGVRIKNNLADLRATWSPIRVTGSSRLPIIAGGIDVERGGMIFAYGQTVRIDSAALTFSGLPGVPAELELETTSTLEDRGLGARASNDVFYAENPLAENEATERGRALAEGLGAYVGNRLVGALGEPLGRTRISLQPLRIFGETDPEARLTLSRDLSSFLSLIVAINLRDSQDRTYLLNVENLPRWPRFAAQAFTNEEENQGAAVLHTWELGGSEPEPGQSRLAELELHHPPEVKASWVKIGIPYREGESLPDSADFDIEIDVADALGKRGFPDPEVSVEVIPLAAPSGGVRLRVEVEPGPRLEVVFTGERPSRAQRRIISDLYRPAAGEEESLVQIQKRTEGFFRERGFPHPQVAVEITHGALIEPPGHRLTIHTEPGEKWRLAEPVFEGADEETAAALAVAFGGLRERVELALSTPAAQRRLLSTLASLGFGEARWLESELDADERIVTVSLEPGPRNRLGTVKVTGWPAELGEIPVPAMERGLGLRADRIASAALGLEKDLRRQGYVRARVRPITRPVDGEDHVFDLELEVEAGEKQRLTEVYSRGQDVTKESWVRRVAGLEPGTLIRSQELAAARRRLLKSGVFKSVQVDTERSENGAEPVVGDGVPTGVVFQVEESPRYTLAAGLRWVSSEGLSTVVDVVDRNVFGRGTTIGLRARYSTQDQALRLYSVVPRLLASPFDLELFAERRVRTETLRRENFDLAAQLSRPLNDRLTIRFYGRFREEKIRQEVGADFDVVRTPIIGTQLVYGAQQVTELAPRGIFSSLDFSGSTEALGSNQDSLRFFGQLSGYLPFRLAGRRLTWGQSVRVGLAEAFDGALADTLRFRAGGELSVRGYSSNSLGPRQLLGEQLEPLGGEASLIFNQELRFHLGEDYAAVAFFDAGNVWAERSSFAEDLFTSVGFGGRADTPIGLVRFDIAWPLDRREDDNSVKLYVGLGNTF